LTNAESKDMSTVENRAWLEARVTADGTPIGLVALRDGVAIGWVSLAPREDFHRLGTSRTIPTLDGDGVWSIVCFVVGRAARRHGLSAALLKAAVAYARQAGATTIEAYPVAPPPDGRVSAASAYTGVESTFLDAGFTRVSETTSKAGGARRVIVRLEVGAYPNPTRSHRSP
jgi:GNAT superfamily N-acetyltransferase